jgi:hypothetical protein
VQAHCYVFGIGHGAVAGLRLKSQDTSYPPETDRATALVSAKASPVVGHDGEPTNNWDDFAVDLTRLFSPPLLRGSGKRINRIRPSTCLSRQSWCNTFLSPIPCATYLSPFTLASFDATVNRTARSRSVRGRKQKLRTRCDRSRCVGSDRDGSKRFAVRARAEPCFHWVLAQKECVI